MSEENIEVLIKQETAKRLEEMQDSSYEFPKKIGKGDVIGISVAVGVSLLLIILCMTGVIL